MLTTAHIGFIGAGNMAQAMIAGLHAHGFPMENVIVAAPSDRALAGLRAQYAITTTHNNVDVVKQSNIVILATKPQQFATVLTPEILTAVHAHQPILISVMTGVLTATLARRLQHPELLIRCMPNVAAGVQHSVTGVYTSHALTSAQRATVDALLQTIGKTVWFDEEDALAYFTPLCGSGPAYFFLLLGELVSQALPKATILQRGLAACSLARHIVDFSELRQHAKEPVAYAIWLILESLAFAAKQLAFAPPALNDLLVDMAIGSLLLAQHSTQDLPALRLSVTSKGGITEQALNVLIQHGIVDCFQNPMKLQQVDATTIKAHFALAIHKAWQRDVAIGGEFDAS